MIFIKQNKYGMLEANYEPFSPLYGEKDSEGNVKTKEQLEKEGFFIESFPTPEKKEGKTPMWKADFKTKTVFYEYVDELKEYQPADPINVLTQTVAKTQIDNIRMNSILQENTKEIAKIKLELIESKSKEV